MANCSFHAFTCTSFYAVRVCGSHSLIEILVVFILTCESNAFPYRTPFLSLYPHPSPNISYHLNSKGSWYNGKKPGCRWTHWHVSWRLSLVCIRTEGNLCDEHPTAGGITPGWEGVFWGMRVRVLLCPSFFDGGFVHAFWWWGLG